MRPIRIMVNNKDEAFQLNDDFKEWEKNNGNPGAVLIQDTVYQYPITTNTSSPTLYLFNGDDSFFIQFPYWKEHK